MVNPQGKQYANSTTHFYESLNGFTFSNPGNHDTDNRTFLGTHFRTYHKADHGSDFNTNGCAHPGLTPTKTSTPAVTNTPVAVSTGSDTFRTCKVVEPRQLTNGYYVVQCGDSLVKVALELCGSQLSYLKIVEANQDKIDNPNLIYGGLKLTIPCIN